MKYGISTFITLCLTMLMHGNAQAHSPTGAIFTTDGSGKLVNGNIYPDQQSVHLNGGPRPTAPCSAAGLPDGQYHFQVTDPSGQTLLSTDDIAERKVQVTGGVIKGYLGTTHATGTGKCTGSISVILFPYNDTSNPGGEYKAWMTPVSDYSPGSGYHGFIPSHSKTDNFKIMNKGKVKLQVECLRDLVLCNTPGKCEATPIYPAPTIIGGFPPYQIQYSPPAGTPAPVGFNCVTVTVTDLKGNQDTCIFSVTVTDCEPPKVTCPPDQIISNDPGECFSTTVATQPLVTDNCPRPVALSGVRSDGKPLNEPWPIGDTTVIWTATDEAGNQSTCSYKVTVKDKTLPYLKCPPDIF